jgi:hypothetical protein
MDGPGSVWTANTVDNSVSECVGIAARSCCLCRKQPGRRLLVLGGFLMWLAYNVYQKISAPK